MSWCILVTLLLVYVIMKFPMHIFFHFFPSVISACEYMRRYLLWHYCFFNWSVHHQCSSTCVVQLAQC